jgi:hypothetical protein
LTESSLVVKSKDKTKIFSPLVTLSLILAGAFIIGTTFILSEMVNGQNDTGLMPQVPAAQTNLTSSSLAAEPNITDMDPIIKELIRYQLKAADVALSNNDTAKVLDLLRLAELETSIIGKHTFLAMNFGIITERPDLLSDIMNNTPTSDGNKFVMQHCFPNPFSNPPLGNPPLGNLICFLPLR